MKHLYYFFFVIFLLTSCQSNNPSSETIPFESESSGSIQSSYSGNIESKGSGVIQSQSGTVDIRIGNCPRGYNLKTKNGTYRKFEFIFRGKCEQKPEKNIEYTAEGLFGIASGQRANLVNVLLMSPSELKKNAKEGFISLFQTNQYHDTWKVNEIDMYISSIPSGGYTDDQNIMIGYNGVFLIEIEGIRGDKIKQEYDDLLWTLKYGFHEIPTQNTIINTSKIDLGKSIFMNGGVMVYDETGLNQFYSIDVLVGDPKPNVAVGICNLPVGEIGNSSLDVSCTLKVFSKNSFQWESEVYQRNGSSITQYETDALTGKTKIIGSSKER